MCLYVAFLSHSLKYNSIINYVSAVRFMHTFLGYNATWENSFSVKATLKGYKRILGAPTEQKLPVTVDMLKDIISRCDPVNDSGYIACILIGFFGMLRKANLCPKSINCFDPQFNLARQDIELTDYGALLNIRGSKVIQFQQKVLQIPLVEHPTRSSICPVRAMKNHMRRVPASPTSPAFQLHSGDPITHHKIREFFKRKLIECGVDYKNISLHSLRRGGASFCHSRGAPLEMIQSMGDWASLAVLCYLTRPLDLRIKTAKLMVC